MNEEDFKQFNELYDKSYPGYGSNPASLWAKTSNGSFYEVASTNDPYELISRFAELGFHGEAIIACTGWAAPLPKDGSSPGRPSEHSERVRVKLFVHLKGEDITNAVWMDGADEPMVDSSGEGMLTDAIGDALRKVKNGDKESWAHHTTFI